MFKKLLTTLLSGSLLLSGVDLPIFAQEQESEIEEMGSAIEEMDEEFKNQSSALEHSKTISEEVEETSLTLMADPYWDESLGLYEKDGLVYQLFADGHAQVEGGENPAIIELYIPSQINFNGKDYKVSGIGHLVDYNKYGLGKFRPRFTGLPNLKKVTVEEGIERITLSAFQDCENLEAVSLPNSITWYGTNAFSSCPKLKNISLSNQAAITRGMFAFCTSLEEITIPDGVSSIARSAFDSCTNLKKVIIPTSVTKFDGEEHDVWYIFLNCPQLTIYGYTPSEAYNYAQRHGIPFVDLSKFPTDEYQLSARIEGDGKTVLINEPFRIQVSLLHNGIIVDSWKDYTFSYEKTGQATLNKSWDLGDSRVFEVTPKLAGPMNLTIGDKKSGASITIDLEVTEKKTQYAYPIFKLEETFFPNAIGDTNIPTNFYNLNGLYINQYDHTEITNNNTKVHKVSFDIYNMNYSYGSVDVYDKDGKLIKINEVKPHRNMTSLIELPDTICKLVSDLWNGKALSYTSETVCQKTSINIEVPDGGYFTVSNNVMNSPGAMIFNSIDAMIFGSNKIINHFTADKTKTKTTIFDLFTMTDIQFMQKYPKEAASLAIKNNILEQVQKSHKTIAKKIAQRFMKESAKAGSKLSFELSVDMGEAIINSLGLNWQTLFGIASGMGEAAFMKFLGPSGVALSVGFTLQGWADEACLALDVFQARNEPYLKLFTQRNFTDLGEGVAVYPESEDSLPSDAILQVYRMCDLSVDGTLKDLASEDYELFNISFVKDENEIQPKSSVKVVMDVPEDYDISRVQLYRQEKDGSWTPIQVNRISDKNQIDFTTDHFSLYLLTQESNLNSTSNEMHRLYNPNSGEHFYTTDKGEKDHLISVGWYYEGLGWKAPKTSNTPVYRLYNENAGDHHYTTDSNEKDTLVRLGWKDEKIGWYSDDQKGVALYRVYNPNAQAGSHHYTTDKTEQDYLVGIGWDNEGIAWYGSK